MKSIAAIAAACVSTLAMASSTTPDYTDMWYNASESGWGANVAQQGNILFVTLFVYGSNGQPVWYVATATQAGASTSGTFTGPLYQTTGPYWQGAFDPNAVTPSQVGTLTFTASKPNEAALSYTVNGVPASKSVVRQTWARDNLAGSYIGGTAGTWSSCGAARNGYVEASAHYTVSQDGATVQVREEGADYTCTYTGTYTPEGRFGTIAGGGLCSDGVNQTFNASEVHVSRDAVSMRLDVTQIGGCRFAGRLGGIRRGAL